MFDHLPLEPPPLVPGEATPRPLTRLLETWKVKESNARQAPIWRLVNHERAQVYAECIADLAALVQAEATPPAGEMFFLAICGDGGPVGKVIIGRAAMRLELDEQFFGPEGPQLDAHREEADARWRDFSDTENQWTQVRGEPFTWNEHGEDYDVTVTIVTEPLPSGPGEAPLRQELTTEPDVTLDRYRVLVRTLVREWWDMDTGMRGGAVDTAVYSTLSDELRYAACEAEGHEWERLPGAIAKTHNYSDSRRCVKCSNLFATVDAIAASEVLLGEKVAALRAPSVIATVSKKQIAGMCVECGSETPEAAWPRVAMLADEVHRLKATCASLEERLQRGERERPERLSHIPEERL